MGEESQRSRRKWYLIYTKKRIWKRIRRIKVKKITRRVIIIRKMILVFNLFVFCFIFMEFNLILSIRII